MSKKRKITTQYSSLLTMQCNQLKAGESLKKCLENEYKYLVEATSKSDKEPLYFMLDNDPKCPYRMKPLDVRPSCHAGQLKLFLSELWFLWKYSSFANTVIYAGAADGQHIKFLAELFPLIHFYLYDPRPFHPSLSGIKNITIKNQMFELDDAKFYSGIPKLLFISDIRSGNPKQNEDFDASVQFDMQNQKKWVEIIKPYCSMLKFCLSYKPGQTEYFAGQLRYGIFATQSGTEMRLIVRDPSALKVYDNTDIEEKCYYFNNFTRIVRYPSIFPTLISKQKWYEIGIDFCFDCIAFLKIAMETIESLEEEKIFAFVMKIINATNSSKKLLLSPHSDIFDQWLTVRKNYNGFDFYSKSETEPKNPKLVDFIHNVYNENPDIAPPIGNYCGFIY